MGLRHWLRRIRTGGQVDARPPTTAAPTALNTDLSIGDLESILLRHAELIRAALPPIDATQLHDQSEGALPSFGSPYCTVALVGSGGMGEVYKAYDLALGRYVAIKVTRASACDEVTLLSNSLLAREPQRLTRLEHPNIVRVYGSGRLVDGRSWYAMEFVEGDTLVEHASKNRLSLRQRIELLTVVAGAVGWMHERRIAHLDLKPANMLVTSDGEPKILDFGLAVALDRDGKAQVAYAVGGGTPGYRAPEVAGAKAVGAGADVYSLGILLLEIVGDRAADFALLEHAIRRASLDALPFPLKRIAARCLDDEPIRRYRNAAELTDDLERYLESRGVRAATGFHPFYHIGAFVGRHRAGMAIAGIAVMCVILVTLAVNSARKTVELTRLARHEEVRAERMAARRSAAQERARLERQRFLADFGSAKQLFEGGRHDEAQAALDRVPSSQWGIECELLQRQLADAPCPRRVVGSHDWGIAACIASPGPIVSAGLDGRLLAWQTGKNEPRILREGRWSVATRQWRHVMDGDQSRPPDAIVALSWIEQGERFVSASLDGTGVVWQLSSDDPDRPIIEHSAPLLSVAVCDGYVAFGAGDGCLLELSVTGGVVTRHQHGDSPVTTIEPASGHRGWWIGHEDGTVRLVEASTGRELASAQFQGPIWQLAEQPSTTNVLIAGGEPAAALCGYDAQARTLSRIRRFSLPPSGRGSPRAVHSARFSESGDEVFLADDLGRLSGVGVSDGRLMFARDDRLASPLSPDDIAGWPLPLRRRAIVQLSDQHELITAGSDTLLKSWPLRLTPWKFVINDVVPGCFAFDGARPDLLWSASTKGHLSVLNVGAETEVNHVELSSHPQLLASCESQSLVATAIDKTAQLWRCSAERIVSIDSSFETMSTIVGLALSPDGQRLAAQTANELIVWSTPSPVPIARRSRADLAAGLSDQIAFNASGTKLAAFGGPQNTIVLDAETLVTLQELRLAAGNGGTALAWHPASADVLFVGDSIGRVSRLPDMALEDLPQVWTEHCRIASLAPTRDGKRVLAATTAGKIVVIEPDDQGPIFAVTAVEGSDSLSGVRVNSTNRLLAVGRSDGQLEVWRLAAADPPLLRTTQAFSSNVLLQGAQGLDIRMNPRSVGLDDRGRIHALYMRVVTEPTTGARGQRLLLGHESPAGWKETLVASLGWLTDRARDDVDRSLRLHIEGERWHALAKLDPSPQGDHVSGLYLLTGRLAEGRHVVENKELVAPGARSGYDPSLTQENGHLRVLHFSHAGHHLLLSERRDDAWRSLPIGRQGDGYRAHHSVDNGHEWLVFRPTRFNGDRSSAICLAMEPTPEGEPSTLARERTDDSYNLASLGLAIVEGATPVVISRRSGDDGRKEVLLQRRLESEWLTRPIIAQMPRSWNISNVVTRSDGAILFASQVRDRGEIGLVSVLPSGVCETDLVWRDPNPTACDRDYILSLRLTQDEEPTVVVGRSSNSRGWLRVFRPSAKWSSKRTGKVIGSCHTPCGRTADSFRGDGVRDL